jgi:thiamine biosynthesis protein ThiS
MSHPQQDSEATAALALEVNGEATRLTAGTTVGALIAALSLGDRKVAVAVNRDVVPRSRYDEFVLSSGDRVEILEAVGGG